MSTSAPSLLHSYSQASGPAEVVICEDLLSPIDPQCVDLPGANWCFCQLDENVIIFCEIVTTAETGWPRIRKHVAMDILNSTCNSYVIDRKISEVPVITKSDVERCIEELQMMNVCIGGPSVTKYPPALRTNAQVDILGNWRHNSCKIIVAWPGTFCEACEPLYFELGAHEFKSVNKKSNAPKRVIISNLSHRKQSQITALRKRRRNWYKKKMSAEKEMKMIEDMISEISEEPETNPLNDEEFQEIQEVQEIEEIEDDD